VAARKKLKSNPLPGLPGQGKYGTVGAPVAGGMPGFRDPGAGMGGMRGADVGAGFGGLPGGYGPSHTLPSREKSKSKSGHVKSASTGTLPAQVSRRLFNANLKLKQTLYYSQPMYILPLKLMSDQLKPMTSHRLSPPSHRGTEEGQGSEIVASAKIGVEAGVGQGQDGTRRTSY
jgi:hypothetical protein